MRTFTVSFAALLVLAGCDPVVSLDVAVVVPPEAQAAFTGTYPAQVAVEHVSRDAEADAEPSPTTFGVLCAESSEAQLFEQHRGYVGCADETEIRAWLLPVPADSVIDCATQPPTIERVTIDPFTDPPWATGVAFKGLREECSRSVDEVVTLTLVAPAVL